MTHDARLRDWLARAGNSVAVADGAMFSANTRLAYEMILDAQENLRNALEELRAIAAWKQ